MGNHWQVNNACNQDSWTFWVDCDPLHMGACQAQCAEFTKKKKKNPTPFFCHDLTFNVLHFQSASPWSMVVTVRLPAEAVKVVTPVIPRRACATGVVLLGTIAVTSSAKLVSSSPPLPSTPSLLLFYMCGCVLDCVCVCCTARYDSSDIKCKIGQ